MEKAKIITTRVKLKYQYLLRARAVGVMAVLDVNTVNKEATFTFPHSSLCHNFILLDVFTNIFSISRSLFIIRPLTEQL